MELICIERIGNEDEYEGFPSVDFNVYFQIDSQMEEVEMRKYLLELKKRFKFLKNKERTELCVFLPNTSNAKALEFSTKLKRKLKEGLKNYIAPEKFHKKAVEDYETNRVISVRAKDGIEEIVLYEVDNDSKIHYLTSINSTRHTRTKLKRMLEGVN